MAVSIKLPSGITVTSTATDEKQAITELNFWANEFPAECGNCKSTNITPRHRVSGKFNYYEARCGKCGHTLSFGQYESGVGLFAKRKDGWKPPYQGGGSERQESQKQSQESDDDSIPY